LLRQKDRENISEQFGFINHKFSVKNQKEKKLNNQKAQKTALDSDIRLFSPKYLTGLPKTPENMFLPINQNHINHYKYTAIRKNTSKLFFFFSIGRPRSDIRIYPPGKSYGPILLNTLKNNGFTDFNY